MRYLIASLILCLGLVLPARAQVIIQLGGERPAPTIGDYEKVLSYYKTASKEAVDLKAWKGRTLIHRRNKDKVEFDKLSNFDKHMYLLSNGYRVNDMMTNIHHFWIMELKRFDDPKYTPKKLEKIEDAKQEPAAKADVEKYLKQLTDLRKASAVRYEKFVEKVCNDFKDEIPEKERELYLKEVRDFNDENNLIERKK